MNSKIDKLKLSKKYLSPTINLLGEILGEVIIEQSGLELFELEEKIRLLSKDFRENQNINSLQDLELIIKGLSDSERSDIINSFSIFFQLVNLAEEDYKIHLDEELSRQETLKDTIKHTIRYSKEMGLSGEDFIKILSNLHFKLVWTAHPTEARRLTNLIKLREIYELIEEIEKTEKENFTSKLLRDKVKEKITLLWQSDDLREVKVKVLDEVRTNLFYFDNTVFDVLPDLVQEIKHHIGEAYGNQLTIENEIPRFIEFGSWVGGDRDGHAGVTSEITIQTLLLQKRLCLRKYLESVKKLIQNLSSSTNQVGISAELKESIASDTKIFREFASRTINLNRLELYRRKLDFVRVKLQNTLEQVELNAERVGLGRTLVGTHQLHTGSNRSKFLAYNRSREFLQDLKIIDRSLRENKGTVIADGELSLLISKVNIFGFHLAPLDIRQHARLHRNAINEILSRISGSSLTNLDKGEQVDLLKSELLNSRPLGVRSFIHECSEETRELISTLEVAKQSLDLISPRAIESYIISMTRNETDLYILLLLMKETNLITIKDDRVDHSCFDVVPLFETREDLINAANVMENMFSDPIYRSLLETRNNVQEIMIGYSDSTKDVGYLQSNYQLFVVQRQLVDVAQSYNVTLRMFHGRGGSISRGGGPTHKSVLSQPPGTLNNMKITQQGEVIGWNYANPKIGRRHLEQIISAVITRSITDVTIANEINPAIPDPNYLDLFCKLAEDARIVYEELVKLNPGFIKFYLEYSPLDIIERTSIGSRPSRRTKSDVDDITSLRAIPWIFSWMQTRLIFTTYYGVGSAMEKFCNKSNLKELIEMYDKWPYFTSLIDNLQMVCLKVDLDIAQKYLELVKSDVDVGKQLFNQIKEEFDRTVKYILQITKSSSLMEHTPDIQNSIKRRNPYIDPLSLIQIELLKSWRANGRPDEHDTFSHQRALLQTINGIAAGLRNTG